MRSGPAWPGRSCPTCWSKNRPAFAEICRKADFSLIQLVTPTTPRERAKRIAERIERVHLLRLGHRHHRRADRTAARPAGKRRLAADANAAADLHRLRHQHAGACEAAGAGGRRPDRRLGDRAAVGGRRREAEGGSVARRRRLRSSVIGGSEIAAASRLVLDGFELASLGAGCSGSPEYSPSSHSSPY